MSLNTFPRKGYGRIFCKSEEDVQAVKDIIRSMDEFEYEYLPDNFITTDMPERIRFSDGTLHDKIPLVYTHKFDSLDLNELQMRCFMAGINIVCWIGGCGDNDVAWIDI